MTVERCPARAALAGNPSDGYGGAVLAIPVPGYRAQVTLAPAERYGMSDGDGTRTFETWDELRAAATDATAGDRHGLVLAAVGHVTETTGPLDPFSITVSTTIPRSVGLAGSSAIVIATVRALREHAQVTPLEPDALASNALHIERDVLQISAGLQDRVVQAHDAPVMMRFGPGSLRTADGFDAGTYETLSAGGRFHLLVAHRLDAAEPSQAVHRPLRERFDDGDDAVLTAMQMLAHEAERAATAFTDGSAVDLGAAMDRSFDLRQSIVALDPRHVEMIATARNAGAFANYCGSGGSIVVLCRDRAHEESVADALISIGCETTSL